MQIVLDSVSLQHLLRKPKVKRRGRSSRPDPTLRTALDHYLGSGDLQIVIDANRGVVSEWGRTCGPEAVQSLIVYWADLKGVHICSTFARIHHHRRNRLRQLGLTDTIDILLIKLALSIPQHNLVSDDSDFWDPADLSRKGDQRAIVSSYLVGTLGINIMVLGQLFAAL